MVNSEAPAINDYDLLDARRNQVGFDREVARSQFIPLKSSPQADIQKLIENVTFHREAVKLRMPPDHTEVSFLSNHLVNLERLLANWYS